MNDQQAALLMFAIGLLGLGLAFFLRRKTKRFLAVAQKATGTVSDHGEHRNAKGRRMYNLKYTYEFPAGTIVTAASSSSSAGVPKQKIGDPIPILIDPTTGEARINSWSELHLGPIALSLFSVAMVLLGATILGQG